jgi:hypothetical protein
LEGISFRMLQALLLSALAFRVGVEKCKSIQTAEKHVICFSSVENSKEFVKILCFGN